MNSRDSELASAQKRKRGFLSEAAFVFLVAAFLYSALAMYTGSWTPVRLVKGVSMQPTFRAGDLVVIKAARLADLRVGDIVAYRTPESLRGSGVPKSIMHRVTAIKASPQGPVLETKGDNAPADLLPVPESALEGKLLLRIPKLGYPAVLLSSGKGLLFLAMFFLIALVFVPVFLALYAGFIRPKDPLAARAPAAVAAAGSGGPVPAALATKIDNLGEQQLVFAGEHRQLRESVTALSKAIEFYAVNLESHTAVVQDLAAVTAQLQRTTTALTSAVEHDRPSAPGALRGRAAVTAHSRRAHSRPARSRVIRGRRTVRGIARPRTLINTGRSPRAGRRTGQRRARHYN